MDPAPSRYVIRIHGAPRHRAVRVPGDGVAADSAHTVLTGLLDQSALDGVPAEIEALSLDMLAVRQREPQRKSPEPGDSRSP